MERPFCPEPKIGYIMKEAPKFKCRECGLKIPDDEDILVTDRESGDEKIICMACHYAAIGYGTRRY